MSSEDVQFHARSVTFQLMSIILTGLSPNFLSVRNQFSFQLHLMSMYYYFVFNIRVVETRL